MSGTYGCDYEHDYATCPVCSQRYCQYVWDSCPRCEDTDEAESEEPDGV